MANHKRPIPYGFADDATKPHEVLKPKYHCNGKQIARWRTELGLPTNGTGKNIDQYTTDGQFVRRFASMRNAMRAVGGGCSENISHCASGRYKTAYGYVWRFTNAD